MNNQNVVPGHALNNDAKNPPVIETEIQALDIQVEAAAAPLAVGMGAPFASGNNPHESGQ
jgi:hypothetical protein